MRLLAPLVAFCFVAGCRVADSGSNADTSDTVTIVNVTVIPMDSNRVLAGHTVVVRQGLVAKLGPTEVVEVPANSRKIDGTGLYLMPGLVDAHVHLRDNSELVSYLAHGVTTVVHLSGPSGEITSVVELAGAVAREEVPGPTIITSGRILDGDPPIFRSVSTVVRTPGEADSVVDTQLAGGVDLIKVYNNLRTDELRAVTRSAHEHGVTVWGHIPRINGRVMALERALSAGLDVIAHGEEVFFTILYRDVDEQVDRGMVPTVDQRLITEAVSLIRRHGATVIPNLSFVAMTRVQLDDLDQVWSDAEAQYLATDVMMMWRQQNPTTRRDLARFDLRERGKYTVVQTLTRALNDAGVRLLLGTDASAPGMFPGRSAHVELAELVAAGLTPFEALATGTRNLGQFFDEHVRSGWTPFGTIKVGSRADMLLLTGNPLENVSNAAHLSGILVRGRWYSRAQLDTLRSRSGS